MRSITPDLSPDEPPMFRPDEVESALRQRSDLDVEYHFQPLEREGAAFEPLVSSQIVPEDWKLIAGTIQRRYEDYDGFVVLHGTDTMAWTASALSFMFSNLSKPIVLTGSQRPILAAPSDAVSNFVNSVMVAGRGNESIPLIPEVVVCFGDLVLRGNRTTKVSVASLQGFDTPNVAHLGRVGRRFDIKAEQVRAAPARVDGCFARLELQPRIADVVLYPGMPASQLACLLENNAGAVLRTFGAGNAPGGKKVQEVLRTAVDKGLVLVNVTQSNEGTVESGMLTDTRALADCGVISGLDLTSEAAFTKLMVLLGSDTPDIARQQMQLDQRGEQSMDFVELRPESQHRGTDGVSRIVLTRSLHARARPDRLVSAVLRLRSAGPRDEHPQECAVTIHLNHWQADHRTDPDLRSLGPYSLSRGGTSDPTWDTVVDLTELGRRILEAGSPVTLTLVPATGSVEVDVVLSLFMERDICELS